MGKKVKKRSAYVIPEEELNDKILAKYTVYDSKDRIIEDVTYESPDVIENKHIISYNEKGQKVKEINVFDNEGNSEAVEYSYNDVGELVEEKITFSEGSVSFKKYDRDDDENIVLITLCDEDGDIEEKEIHYVDENKNVVKREIYNDRDKVEQIFVNEFDEKNRLVKQSEYYKKLKNLTIEKQFYYDESDHLTKSISLNRKGKVSEIQKNIYDDKGRILEHSENNIVHRKYSYNDEANTIIVEQLQQPGFPELTTEIRRNDDGLLIEEINNFTHIIYEYEFFEEEEVNQEDT